MHRRLRPKSTPGGIWFLVVGSILFAVRIQALSVAPPPETEQVARDTLIERLEAKLSETPEHQEARLALGRMYLFAYARNWHEFPVYALHPEPVKWWLADPFIPLHSSGLALPVSPERLVDLVSAIGQFQRLTEIHPSYYPGHIALGYACLEASRRCNDAGWPAGHVALDRVAGDSREVRRHWEDCALESLREGARLRASVEAQDGRSLIPSWENDVHCESLLIFRLLAARDGQSSEAQAERESYKENAERVVWAHGRPIEGSFEPIEAGGVPPALVREIEGHLPTVPAAENAAEYYLHALDCWIYAVDTYNPDLPLFESRLPDLPPGPLSEASVALMEQLLRANSETLRFIRTARAWPQARYLVDFSHGDGVNLWHLNSTRQLALLAGLNALYQVQAGDTGQTMEALLDTLAVPRSLVAEPFLIAMQVRGSSENTALSVLRYAVNHLSLSESQLERVQLALEELEQPQSLLTAVAGERFWAGLPLEAPRYEDLSDDPLAQKMTEQEFQIMVEQLRVQHEESKKARVSETDELLAIASLPIDEVYKAIMPKVLEDKQTPRVSGRRMGLMAKFVYGYVCSVTSLRVTQAALALERFRLENGRLPHTLEALVPAYIAGETLVDPFTGEQLLFKAEGEGNFTVLSAMAETGEGSLSSEIGRSVPWGISFTMGR